VSASGSWTSGAARRTGLPQRTRRKASRTSPTGEAELSRRFCGWHEPIAAVLEAADEAAILRNDVYYLGPLPRWSEGRVVLVGDAAHATTPGVGQGPGDRGRRRTRRRARSRRHATGCPRRLRVDPPAADRSRAEDVPSRRPGRAARESARLAAPKRRRAPDARAGSSSPARVARPLRGGGNRTSLTAGRWRVLAASVGALIAPPPGHRAVGYHRGIAAARRPSSE